LLQTPQVTVITDYDAHAYWANYPTEAFFVGQPCAAANLMHVNPLIRDNSIHTSGIPVVPAFASAPSKEECIARLGLNGKIGPIVLLTASGALYNDRPSIFTLFEQALSVQTPLEIIVITGRQADLRKELAMIAVPSRHSVRLEGFTRVMHEYMGAADIIVTKPGGLTTAESLATGLAMIVVSPYPGQEMRNTDQLLEEGIALKCNDLYLLRYKLELLATDPVRLARMQQNALCLGRSKAVCEVSDFLAAGKYGYIDYAQEKKERLSGQRATKRTWFSRSVVQPLAMAASYVASNVTPKFALRSPWRRTAMNHHRTREPGFGRAPLHAYGRHRILCSGPTLGALPSRPAYVPFR